MILQGEEKGNVWLGTQINKFSSPMYRHVFVYYSSSLRRWGIVLFSYIQIHVTIFQLLYIAFVHLKFHFNDAVFKDWKPNDINQGLKTTQLSIKIPDNLNKDIPFYLSLKIKNKILKDRAKWRIRKPYSLVYQRQFRRSN